MAEHSRGPSRRGSRAWPGAGADPPFQRALGGGRDPLTCGSFLRFDNENLPKVSILMGPDATGCAGGLRPAGFAGALARAAPRCRGAGSSRLSLSRTRIRLRAALNAARPVRGSWLSRRIVKLGSAARAAGSLPPDSDLEDLTRFGRADGTGTLWPCAARPKPERNAKRPPRRNRAGALLESFHHTSSDCARQESELRAVEST